jgi:hypothetical protein
MSQRRIKHRRQATVNARPSAKSQPPEATGEPPVQPQPVQGYTDEEVGRLRFGFLDSLDRWTPFFVSLNDAVWRSRDPNALIDWKAKQRITIEGWLVEAVEDTLAYWTEYPGSPQAQLAPGYQHFAWRGGGVKLRLFTPVFTPPQTETPSGFVNLAMNTPVSERGSLGTRISAEQPEKLKARYEAEFKTQLDEYMHWYTRAVCDEEWLSKHPQRLRDLTWLMYRVAGVPKKDVVAKLSSSYTREGDEMLVRRVNDIAKIIGLRMAPWN